MLGDAAAGAVVGACLTLAAGTLVPLAAHAARPRLRTLVLALVATSAVCAAAASWRHAYSPAFPKRVFLQHRHEVHIHVVSLCSCRHVIAGDLIK